MNLKIECSCGQKIAFDVEPEAGAMPCSVPCPSCSADITPLANTEIQRQLSAAPPAPAAPSVPRLRVSHGAGTHSPQPPPTPAPAAAQAPSSAPALSTAAHTPAAPRSMSTVMAAAAAAAPLPDDGSDQAKMGSFLMGVVGVIGGAVAGLVLWLIIAKAGFNPRILAILVGAGAGGGGRLLCRGGDKGLGGVAAVIAVAAMFAGGAMTANEGLKRHLGVDDKGLHAAYESAIDDAKEMVRAIPTGSDVEIRNYLIKREGSADAVTDEDIAQFKEDEDYKQAKDMASGKITFEQFRANIDKALHELDETAGKAVGAIGAVRMLSIWLIGLVGGTAYKIAAG